MLSNEVKQELTETLLKRIRAKGKTEVCPMCGNDHFTLSDAYLVNVLQPDINSMSLSGVSIPAIGIICTNCGFISQHALGAIGKLPKKEDK